MRRLFPGYFQHSQEELLNNWHEMTFIIDSSVLLNLFTCSQGLAAERLTFLNSIQERLWSPFHGMKLFLESYPYIMHRKLAEADSFIEKLHTYRSSIAEDMNGHCNPIYSFSDDQRASLNGLFENLSESVSRNRRIYSQASKKLFAAISELFEHSIGYPLSEEELSQIPQTAERRARLNMPPFIEEKPQEQSFRFFPLISWFEIIEYVTKQKQPVVVLTDGHPGSWWKQITDKEHLPLPELGNELSSHLNVFFHISEIESIQEFYQRNSSFLTVETPGEPIEV